MVTPTAPDVVARADEPSLPMLRCCRRDGVRGVSLADTRRRGGGGCILAERLLPEIAYKLGRAHKYGA